ncbi:type II toxin-antitoxin system RatA family toxin [Allohahella marinimesophila]|uniref:Type II toxin-antitoxin system RatA family toxin n=1 Tax=Allohahella marinimesophila TaxID=1054972 RepID=A0ABP7Q1W9_9GAMM
MAEIVKSALILRTPVQMFELVNDVKAYPQFLPWCRRVAVLSACDNSMTASLTVGKGRVVHSFTTKNILSPHESIHMQLVDGPLSRLQGTWQFKALGPDGCRVTLALDYGLTGRLSALAAESVLQSMAGEVMDAFIKRAGELY